MILSILATAVSAWTAWSGYTLFSHYRQAQCLGVPILISPVGFSNIAWLVLQDSCAHYIARLPFGLGSWVYYNRRLWIWTFTDRGRIHQKYGSIIAFVSPAEIQILVADKDVAYELLKGKDRGLFDKPREDIDRVDFLGPHLMTACGETWKRHRRIVATPFNQRNNRIVWRESLQQGKLLGEHWLNNSQGGVRTVWKDNETCAMNVMVSAGFGLPRESHKSLAETSGNSFDFHSSLSFMVTHFIWVVIVPSTLWFPRNLPPFPESLRSFFKSVRSFKNHLDRMVKESKGSAISDEIEPPEVSSYAKRLHSDNLLSALVRHSEVVRNDDQEASATSTKARNFLTDDEIHSNLFGLAFAGHETTAHTLAYSIFLLSAHPEVQEWVAEEIREVLKGGADFDDLEMDSIFPKLKRTKAIMYETLRVFTPLANVFKRSLSKQEVTLQVGSRTLRIPPRAYVLPSLYALHSSEEYWGKDSLEWNPARWITVNTEGVEEFIQPSPAGAFLPWSDGPRTCPGARFSVVEFVAVCASLLSRFRVTAMSMEGEDEDATRGRVKSALYDSTSVVTLMVKNPESIPLRLERIE